MHQMQSSFTSSMLLRVDSLENIKSSYENQTLRFSCAANWIDYAKKGNTSIGDHLECTFAHFPKNDDTQFFDSHGHPMGNHLMVTEDQRDGSKYVCLIPSLLIPSMCFYTVNLEKIEKFEGIPYHPQCTCFMLDKYCECMDYKREDAAFLLIKDPEQFIEELSSLVPQLVKDNKKRLTTTRYYQTGQTPSLYVDEVNYDRHTEADFYNDEAESYGALFWKNPRYRWQSEVRAIIANINFCQFYDPNYYDYKRNRLDIYMPHLKDYTEWFPANSKSRIDIYRVEGSEGINYSLV